MPAHVITGSINDKQATVFTKLETEQGGRSAALQYLIDFYISAMSDDEDLIVFDVHSGGDDGADMPTE